LRKGEQSTKYFSLVKTNPKSYAPTITATTGTKGAAKPIHWDNRSFTVSEVKRIMSIPDDYILTGSYSQQVERLGRMVAPLMYKHLCEHLIKIGVL
jgi:DNA (cytosine-5)-methyltransferase 1